MPFYIFSCIAQLPLPSKKLASAPFRAVQTQLINKRQAQDDCHWVGGHASCGAVVGYSGLSVLEESLLRFREHALEASSLGPMSSGTRARFSMSQSGRLEEETGRGGGTTTSSRAFRGRGVKVANLERRPGNLRRDFGRFISTIK